MIKQKKQDINVLRKNFLVMLIKILTSKDNIIVIVTFPPCLQRGCQDLINEYKKICKKDTNIL